MHQIASFKAATDRLERETTTALVDKRHSQELEPVRLPPKLQERVEKAQRLAAAAKDGGFLIFYFLFVFV